MNQTTEPSHARKRIVMIMGVQRSGTTALFEALATAPGVTPRHESKNDDLYLDWFLRPEPEIRSVLASLPGTVLLKPVRESEVRSPRSVWQEYADYDLHIVWLYRDPINVFDSYVRRGWETDDEINAVAFVSHWQRRNAIAVADASHMGDRLVVIRYEDLVLDSQVLPRLAERLGMVVQTTFGADSAQGRKRQPKGRCLTFDAFTAEVRSRLDQLRAIRPADNRHSVAKGKPRFIDRLRSAARRLDSRGKVNSPVLLDYDSNTDALLRVIRPADHRDSAAKGKPQFIDRLRSAARRVDSRGKITSPVLRDHGSDAETFLSLGYDTSRLILGCSRPTRPTPALGLALRKGVARTDLEHFLAARRGGVVARIEAAADGWLTRLPRRRECDLLVHLHSFAISAMAAWLDVPQSLAEAFHGEVRPLYLSAGSSGPSPAWGPLRDALMRRGSIADMCATGLLERDDVLGFVCDTAMRLLAVPALVCHALAVVHLSPEMTALARDCPATIPRIFAESMRLVPMGFSLRRRMSQSLRVAELLIPEKATVDVFVALANRDPAAFDAPDDLRPDRRGLYPILLDTDEPGFSGLTDAPPWGSSHMLFDISALVLERLLAGPLTLSFPNPPRTMILPMTGGNRVQMPFAPLVTLDSRTA